MITLQQWDGTRWVERQVTEAEVAERGAELAHGKRAALVRNLERGRGEMRLYALSEPLDGQRPTSSRPRPMARSWTSGN